MYILLSKILNNNTTLIGCELANSNKTTIKLLMNDIKTLVSRGEIEGLSLENGEINWGNIEVPTEYYSPYTRDDATCRFDDEFDENNQSYLRRLIKFIEPQLYKANAELVGLDFDKEYSHNMRINHLQAKFRLKHRKEVFIWYHLQMRKIYLKEENKTVYRMCIKADVYKNGENYHLCTKHNLNFCCDTELLQTLDLLSELLSLI